MPPAGDTSGLETKLAHWRAYRDFSQQELAERTGIRLGTLRRLEQGVGQRPPDIRLLQNCALALGCQLTDLLEDDLLGWTALPGGPVEAPAPEPSWPPGPPPSLAAAGRLPRKLDRDLSGRTRKPTGWRAYRDA
jgi:DNA-binding Xre family transcriptional regulator